MAKNRIEWGLMTPESIEIRPAQVKDGKVTLLAYQNGRNTMDALDGMFGEFGWKVEYKDVAGQIYGRLSIKDPESGEWIYKEDTGEESNISASKGQSTDILKRLAVRFGYGRELYTIPRIVIDDDGYGNHVKVGAVEWDKNRSCTYITLVNRFGKCVYEWSREEKKQFPIKMVSGKDNKTILREFCRERIKDEPEWREDIIKFGTFYSDKLDQEAWKGEFKVDRLYDAWTAKRYRKSS